MTRYGSLCLLIASVAWGGFASAQQAESRQAQAGAKSAPAPESGAKDSPAADPVPPDTPVITIQGVCDHPSSEPAPPNCKMVITRAEFERTMELLHPHYAPSARKSLADKYAKYLITAYRAQERGLDKRTDFEIKMEIDRMALGRRVLEDKFDAEEKAKITDKEIEAYYEAHIGEFEELDVDRVFVPKMPRTQDSDPKLSQAEQKKRRQEWLEELRQEAEKLRVRALAGEDFLKLQVEACVFAGLTDKDADPSMITLLNVRRGMFSEGQRPVMDVKTGEISPVLTDQNGYSIFRVKTRKVLPLEKATVEIRHSLRAEHAKHDMDVLLQSATATYDAGYFGPETPEGSAGHQAPSPTTP